MTEEEISRWFDYNKPTDDQVRHMQIWREKASALACDFAQYAPDGPDKTVALRKLKDTLMAMNAALVSPSPSPKRST